MEVATACEEPDLMVVGDTQQLPEVAPGLVDYFPELLGIGVDVEERDTRLSVGLIAGCKHVVFETVLQGWYHVGRSSCEGHRQGFVCSLHGDD